MASDRKTFESLLEKAQSYQYQSKDSAFYFLEQAKELSVSLGDRNLKGKVANREGAVHYVAGNYQIALEKFMDAEKIFKHSKTSPDYIFALNGRGLIYLGQKQFKEAIEIWETTLIMNEDIKDAQATAKNLFNLGIAYAELKEFDHALEKLTKSLKIISEHPNNELRYMVQNRLAKTYYDIGNIPMAERHYQKVLADSAIINNWEKTFSFTGMAEVRQAQNNFEEALHLAKKGYEYGLFVGAYWDLCRATVSLADIYEAQGDYESALHFNRLHKNYSDSLYSEAKDLQLSALELKLAKAENENLRSEKEMMDDVVIRKNFILSLLVMVLMGFVFIAFIYRKSLKHKEAFNKTLRKKNKAIHKQKKEISAKNKTLSHLNEAKTRIFSVLTHDLRSPINSIKQLLELQKEGVFTQEETDQALELLYEQIVKTDQMMAQLLQWANQQLEGTAVDQQRLELTKEVDRVIDIYDFQAGAKKIKVTHQKAEDIHILIDAGDLKIILQNLLNNAIKFTPAEGKIDYFYTFEGDNSVNLHIKDTGMGMEKEQIDFLKGSDLKMMDSVLGTDREAGTGLGLLLVKQFLSNNGASLQIESKKGEGTEFILTFSLVDEPVLQAK